MIHHLFAVFTEFTADLFVTNKWDNIFFRSREVDTLGLIPRELLSSIRLNLRYTWAHSRFSAEQSRLGNLQPVFSTLGA